VLDNSFNSLINSATTYYGVPTFNNGLKVGNTNNVFFNGLSNGFPYDYYLNYNFIQCEFGSNMSSIQGNLTVTHNFLMSNPSGTCTINNPTINGASSFAGNISQSSGVNPF
jgi:hypothetical protein